MTSGPADDDRPAYVIFHDIGRFRAQLFDRLIAPHGLTMSQAWVLAHLFVEDKLTQTEIARRMEMGTVTVGGLVDRLEAADLVRREASPTDRRSHAIVVTDAGRAMIDRLKTDVRQHEDRVAGALDAKEFDTLLVLLAKLNDS